MGDACDYERLITRLMPVAMDPAAVGRIVTAEKLTGAQIGQLIARLGVRYDEIGMGIRMCDAITEVIRDENR
ncbi:hypothetical protein I5Q34_07300 [Streptomyces sp. AV19]|uniref:hypothetical protein n=1 Tax=Streptomyces sp. AV19 TaxID=2793068 RepID=UPI0018FE3309|nr:hypothetical protein [Streptomyces sp. AV19]MBH1934101.1 hypothetical protein [Streptomyces sp. AV19]MDG4537177.1 hypothetical protein [Streptomyces sp. AV19]